MTNVYTAITTWNDSTTGVIIVQEANSRKVSARCNTCLSVIWADRETGSSHWYCSGASCPRKFIVADGSSIWHLPSEHDGAENRRFREWASNWLGVPQHKLDIEITYP